MGLEAGSRKRGDAGGRVCAGGRMGGQGTSVPRPPPLVGLRAREGGSAGNQRVGLVNPVLRLLLIQRLVVEGRIVQRLPDLSGEGVTLRGQGGDLRIDRGVGAVV